MPERGSEEWNKLAEERTLLQNQDMALEEEQRQKADAAWRAAWDEYVPQRKANYKRITELFFLLYPEMLDK